MLRRTAARRFICCCCAAALAPCATAIDTFQNVPTLYTQSPEVFRSLFARANCSTVRVLMFGDSQETAPGGQGAVYVPRFNYELWRAYGNTPETPLTSMFSYSGPGLPWGDWLLGTGIANPGLGLSRLPPTAFAPNMSGATSCVPDGANVNNNQWFGQLITVEHDGHVVNPAAAIPTGNEYFNRGQSCHIDVIAATNPSSGEVLVRVCPTMDGASNFYAPTRATLVSTMGLESPGPTQFRSQRIGPLPFAGNAYMQVELSGTRADKLTDLVAARLVSDVDRHGMVVSSIAQGGYRATSIFENHANCGPLLRAIDADLVIMTYGANDCNYRTPEQYKSDLTNLIAFVRANTRPDFPIILVADLYRVGLSPSMADVLDRYPGACHEIALADPHVCALNSRRLTDALGWNAADYRQFVSDTVHYTPAGAMLKARVEVEALMSAFNHPCAADLTHDCGVGIEDLLAFLDFFRNGAAEADVDDGTSTGTRDGGVTVEDLLYFLFRFDAGC